jgi:hypothetical protein
MVFMVFEYPYRDGTVPEPKFITPSKPACNDIEPSP